MNRHTQDLSASQLRRLFAGALLTLAVSALTACNTTEGAGEDIEAAGEAIQDAAE